MKFLFFIQFLSICAIAFALDQPSKAKQSPQLKQGSQDIIWVDVNANEEDEFGTKEAPYSSITSALEEAEEDSIINVLPGNYSENISISTQVTLKGVGTVPIELKASNNKQPVIRVNGNVFLTNFRISAGSEGIVLNPGAQARIQDCQIQDNRGDGIQLKANREGARPAFLWLKNSNLSQNEDGLDVNEAVASVSNSTLCYNRDDGLDVDGDSRVEILSSSLCGNGDDGIEVRLKKATQVSIQVSKLYENWEDGLEIIHSPQLNTWQNKIEVSNSEFYRNKRYGIGGVTHETEEPDEKKPVAHIHLKENLFRDNALADLKGIAAQYVVNDNT